MQTSKALSSALAAAVLVAALAGCSSVREAPASSADDAPVSETVEAPAEAEAVTGTRDNPAPLGTVVEVADNSGATFNVTVGAVVLNANDAVTAANEYNAAPDEGSQYMLVPVTFKYVGKTTGTPWVDVSISFVSAAGTTYDTTSTFVVIPTPVFEINEMYPDAEAAGNVVLMVPSADIEKGTLSISTLFGGEKFFVAVV